jgi:hypothetical protein
MNERRKKSGLRPSRGQSSAFIGPRRSCFPQDSRPLICLRSVSRVLSFQKDWNFTLFTAMRLATVDFPDMHKEIGAWVMLRQ